MKNEKCELIHLRKRIKTQINGEKKWRDVEQQSCNAICVACEETSEHENNNSLYMALVAAAPLILCSVLK